MRTFRSVAVVACVAIGVLGVTTGVAWASPTVLCMKAAANGAVKGPTTVGGSTCKAGFSKITLPSSEEQEVLNKVMPYIKYKASGVGGKPTIQVSGANLQILNGEGSTATTNGAGNLVLGYDESVSGESPEQTGSHNLAVGIEQGYRSYGAVLAGRANGAFGPYEVLFGYGNHAFGPYASVTGGDSNSAKGESASVAGGTENLADGLWSSVSGGAGNHAFGILSSVSGGEGSLAEGNYSSVSGGVKGAAKGNYSSVSAGNENIASGERSSVTGGGGNTAAGTDSSISGGGDNEASGTGSSVSGGGVNKASGEDSSIFGGKELKAEAPFSHFP